MFDKKISVGTVITIITIVATCIYTQGIMTNRIEVTEDKSNDNSMKLSSNRDKIHSDHKIQYKCKIWIHEQKEQRTNHKGFDKGYSIKSE